MVLTAGVFLLSGHYVCDCIYPDRSPDDLSDPWMILNDATVILTNGAEICEQRSSLGYILFYKRNVRTHAAPRPVWGRPEVNEVVVTCCLFVFLGCGYLCL